MPRKNPSKWNIPGRIIQWIKDLYWGLYWIAWGLSAPHETTGEKDDD